MDENIFSGLPSLDDTQGLDQLISNTEAANFGLTNDPIASVATQQNLTNTETNTESTETTQSTQNTQPATNTAATQPTFTSEQVAQILQRVQEANARSTQAAQEAQRAYANSTYTPQQASTIKQLIDRGVPLERIMSAIKPQSAVNGIEAKVQQIEQYLQQQKYESEQSEFINKMTTFGNKFGLSENDLVTFGNKALSIGVNLTTVSDLEAVFRAIYPEQYAIRVQRMSNNPASQIYGGANTSDSSRAVENKAVDAYVDNFFKSTMPNQYSMHYAK